MRRFLIFILIIFLIQSIYKDLSLSTEKPVERQESEETFVQVIQVKTEPGDTIFSIMEELHDGARFKRQIILQDFQKLNPSADPLQLEAYKFYFFPIYNISQ